MHSKSDSTVYTHVSILFYEVKITWVPSSCQHFHFGGHRLLFKIISVLTCLSKAFQMWLKIKAMRSSQSENSVKEYNNLACVVGSCNNHVTPENVVLPDLLHQWVDDLLVPLHSPATLVTHTMEAHGGYSKYTCENESNIFSFILLHEKEKLTHLDAPHKMG